MRESYTPSPEEMAKIHEEALEVNEELDKILAEGKYTDVQETVDMIIRKRELAKSFREEYQKALAELPEGKQPAMSINEKGVVNMYMVKHFFGKDFTMKHIAECLVKGEEVTDQLKYRAEGSRYFKLDIPNGAGLPGRFIVPQESGSPLAEHVANWNQACEFKFRHGKLAPVIKKKDLPQWLIDYESTFFVIVEKNQLPNGKLQVADGPTENDPEGSWLISTVHYGQPSRIKPRPPKEPKWDTLKNDPTAFAEAVVQYQRDLAKYLSDYDAWSDEQRRIVFIDLEEEGVGQRGIKEEPKMQEKPTDPNALKIAELENENVVLRKMVQGLSGQIAQIEGEIKGLKKK